MYLSMPLFVRALFPLRLAQKKIKRALEAFYAPHPETPELTLDEINEEIRAARRERKERLARENAEKHWSASGYSGAIFQWIFEWNRN